MWSCFVSLSSFWFVGRRKSSSDASRLPSLSLTFSTCLVDFTLNERSCRTCLASCWTLAITEGDVGAVSCPSVECVKKRTSTAPLPSPELEVDVVREEEEAKRKGEEEFEFGEVVRDLLGEESHERWVRLKEKKRVESGEFFAFFLLRPLPVFALISSLKRSLHAILYARDVLTR